MSYYLIKGHFYVVGYSPDGDSVKFRASNPEHWKKINSDHEKAFWKGFNSGPDTELGIVTLRLQAVDALETHYTPPLIPTPDDIESIPVGTEQPKRKRQSQPKALAIQATDHFMHYLGIKKVNWNFGGTSISSIVVKDGRKTKVVWKKLDEEIPGYIIARDFERAGRPIAWVFEGTTRTTDGKVITTKDLNRRLRQSANYDLLKHGLVYPYFFMTLPSLIRTQLAELVEKAREEAVPFIKSRRDLNRALEALQTEAAEKGNTIPEKYPNIWVYDPTSKGIKIDDIADITDLDNAKKENEIWGYLFRRIVRHWYKENMERFWEAIRQGDEYDVTQESKVDLRAFFETTNPYIFVVSELDFVRIDQVVEIKRGRLKMKFPPHDLVFLS